VGNVAEKFPATIGCNPNAFPALYTANVAAELPVAVAPLAPPSITIHGMIPVALVAPNASELPVAVGAVPKKIFVFVAATAAFPILSPRMNAVAPVERDKAPEVVLDS
jgi:hypothetical protein